jgi:hypothetical protein
MPYGAYFPTFLYKLTDTPMQCLPIAIFIFLSALKISETKQLLCQTVTSDEKPN